MSMVLGTPAVEYGSPDLYRAHVLEQYRIYAGRIAADQSKNEATNAFFLTVNTAIVTAMAFIAKGDFGSHGISVALILLPAVAICLVWWVALRSIAQWSVAQQETLQDMESYLPLKPFTSEWYEKMAKNRGYFKIRVVRQFVPWVFICVHLTLFVSLLVAS